MRTFIQLENTLPGQLPEQWRDDDVRFPQALVAFFIREWTAPGDVVFDPFAGFGTTLVVSQSLGRTPTGIEYDLKRAEYIRTQLHDPESIIHGDSRTLHKYNLPAFDLSISSPPYMQRGDPSNPLTAYSEPGRGYEAYLKDIQDVYSQLAPLMKPDARVVIEASNLKGAGGITTLAWDIAGAVGEVLHFEGEIVVGWEPHYGYGYDHSYCLVFTQPGQRGNRE